MTHSWSVRFADVEKIHIKSMHFSRFEDADKNFLTPDLAGIFRISGDSFSREYSGGKVVALNGYDKKFYKTKIEDAPFEKSECNGPDGIRGFNNYYFIPDRLYDELTEPKSKLNCPDGIRVFNHDYCIPDRLHDSLTELSYYLSESYLHLTELYHTLLDY